MKPIYTITGGGYAADEPMTTISSPKNPPPGVTWPGVKVTLYADHVDYTITGRTFSLALNEIESVAPVMSAPIIGNGVRINHHGNAPKILIIWILVGRKKLLREFANVGVTIGDKEKAGAIKPGRMQLGRIAILVLVGLIILWITSKH